MNYLYILIDRVNFFNSNNIEDYVIVNRDFDLMGTKMDLGFTNQDKPIFNDKFYSIPLLHKPEFQFNNLKNIALFCENYRKKDKRFKRFLVNIYELSDPQLVEATGQKNSYLNKHGQLNSKEVENKIRGFNSRIQKLENILEI